MQQRASSTLSAPALTDKQNPCYNLFQMNKDDIIASRLLSGRIVGKTSPFATGAKEHGLMAGKIGNAFKEQQKLLSDS